MRHTPLEVAELANEGIFIIGVGVVDSAVAAWDVDCSRGLNVGEVILYDGFVSKYSCLESNVVGDHGIEDESAMWSMCACGSLVDIVLHGPRSEGHTAVNRQVDWDHNKDMGDGFISGEGEAGDGGSGGYSCGEQRANMEVIFDVDWNFVLLGKKEDGCAIVCRGDFSRPHAAKPTGGVFKHVLLLVSGGIQLNRDFTIEEDVA